jgi:hypothetical protein
VTTRSSKCKACSARTTASGGYCQRCKSLRHHGYKRIKEENLIVDQAGGAWWIWDARGDVLVAGKPTRDAAILALVLGDVEEDAEEAHATRRSSKTSAQLDAEIAEALAKPRGFRRDKATRKRIPDDVRTAIETGALEIIEGSYRRHATTGGKEPCVTVGLVTDYLRQAHMPEDFRWATKEQQRTWTRSTLEAMRRRGQIGSSLSGTARCYEPTR